jgi:hypothetical protein
MKRSASVKLVMLGGLLAGGCGPNSSQRPPLSTSLVYTNNDYVPGVGYYHAPFCRWYSLPYNHYDPAIKQYYFDGHWSAMPHESITNISGPSAAAVAAAQPPTSVSRGGFGRTSRSHSVWS